MFKFKQSLSEACQQVTDVQQVSENSKLLVVIFGLEGASSDDGGISTRRKESKLLNGAVVGIRFWKKRA